MTKLHTENNYKYRIGL